MLTEARRRRLDPRRTTTPACSSHQRGGSRGARWRAREVAPSTASSRGGRAGSRGRWERPLSTRGRAQTRQGKLLPPFDGELARWQGGGPAGWCRCCRARELDSVAGVAAPSPPCRAGVPRAGVAVPSPPCSRARFAAAVLASSIPQADGGERTHHSRGGGDRPAGMGSAGYACFAAHL
jgi:hypothetical protein